MTGILEVDTEALHRLAERIRAAAGEAQATAGHPGPLHSSIDALNAPVLVRACGVFVESWRAALADIVDDSHRLADAITLAGQSYQDVESAAHQGFLR
jgi:uncharacterized protein YukE